MAHLVALSTQIAKKKFDFFMQAFASAAEK